MINKIKMTAELLFEHERFDFLSIGLIDFKNANFEEIHLNKEGYSGKIYFDLASMTKPLVLASTFLAHPNWFDENLKLLLNHEGSLPSWGRIPHSHWRDYLKEFPILKAKTLYSDYSALRLMIELEDKKNVKLKDVIKEWLDPEVIFWKDLNKQHKTPTYGEREGRVIEREVHDPNAYTIDDFCSHAGLFSTLGGVCKTILTLNSKYKLLEVINHEYESNNNLNRFILGWDRAEDLEKTLAGKGCSKKTFGHLGFTGTSIWIDLEKQKALCILSNATKYYWYDKEGINSIRRTLGEIFWKT